MKLSKLVSQTGMLSSIFLLSIVFSTSAKSVENVNQNVVRSATFANCVNLDNSQLVTRVKNDYLQNRLPRWQEDKKALGPKPVASINANEIIKTDNRYQMVLDVRGARTDLRYNVQVNCDDNTITYVSIQ